MLRLSRMSDYAVVVLSHLAKEPDRYQNTSEVSQATGLPLPTVGKILHRLSEVNLVSASRGRFGGYQLEKLPNDVSLSELLGTFEGPLALTDCLDDAGGICELASHCAVAGRWGVVSRAISRVLDELTLADLVNPLLPYRDNPGEEDAHPL